MTSNTVLLAATFQGSPTELTPHPPSLDGMYTFQLCPNRHQLIVRILLIQPLSLLLRLEQSEISAHFKSKLNDARTATENC